MSLYSGLGFNKVHAFDNTPERAQNPSYCKPEYCRPMNWTTGKKRQPWPERPVNMRGPQVMAGEYTGAPLLSGVLAIVITPWWGTQLVTQKQEWNNQYFSIFYWLSWEWNKKAWNAWKRLSRNGSKWLELVGPCLKSKEMAGNKWKYIKLIEIVKLTQNGFIRKLECRIHMRRTL